MLKFHVVHLLLADISLTVTSFQKLCRCSESKGAADTEETAPTESVSADLTGRSDPPKRSDDQL